MNKPLLKRFASAGSVGLSAIVLTALGVLILTIPSGTAWAMQIALSVVIMANGFIDIVSALRGKYTHSKLVTILAGFVYIGLGFLFLRFPNLLMNLVPNLFGIYFLINSLTRFITFWLYLKGRIRGAFFQFFSALLTLVFAIILFFVSAEDVAALSIPIGVYCLILAGFNISDLIRLLIPSKTKTNIKRHFRLSLPVVIAAFMPKFAFDAVAEELERTGGAAAEELNVKKTDEKADMLVYVHSGKSGPAAFGHVDLCFDGVLYSYGSYDSASQRMWAALGDGVLFTLDDPDKYIDFSLKEMKKTMFCFGLKLSEEQKENVRKRLAEIKETLCPWEPAAKLAAARGEDDPETINDFSSRLWRATDATFYKFKEGIFKSYFVLSTNCVLLADRVIGSAGTDIISLNGIITPGAYYDYLNRELQYDNSMVISRTVYYQNKPKPHRWFHKKKTA